MLNEQEATPILVLQQRGAISEKFNSQLDQLQKNGIKYDTKIISNEKPIPESEQEIVSFIRDGNYQLVLIDRNVMLPIWGIMEQKVLLPASMINTVPQVTDANPLCAFNHTLKPGPLRVKDKFYSVEQIIPIIVQAESLETKQEVACCIIHKSFCNCFASRQVAFYCKGSCFL